MQPSRILKTMFVVLFTAGFHVVFAQTDTAAKPQKKYKNVIRYNLSSALLFGADKFMIFGYERVVNKNQSFSINFGRAALPTSGNISTDSFSLNRNYNNSGFNTSVDYRFYLQKENKYGPPHGFYVGPFYSFNNFKRETDWNFDKQGNENKIIKTNTKFNIHTIGAEVGYQAVLWKRLTLDFVMVGPGYASYNLNTVIDGELSDENKDQLHQALEDMLTEKFPGMNVVFSEQEIDANGRVNTWSIGYRYLIHIGFLF